MNSSSSSSPNIPNSSGTGAPVKTSTTTAELIGYVGEWLQSKSSPLLDLEIAINAAGGWEKWAQYDIACHLNRRGFTNVYCELPGFESAQRIDLALNTAKYAIELKTFNKVSDKTLVKFADRLKDDKVKFKKSVLSPAFQDFKPLTIGIFYFLVMDNSFQKTISDLTAAGFQYINIFLGDRLFYIFYSEPQSKSAINQSNSSSSSSNQVNGIPVNFGNNSNSSSSSSSTSSSSSFPSSSSSSSSSAPINAQPKPVQSSRVFDNMEEEKIITGVPDNSSSSNNAAPRPPRQPFSTPESIARSIESLLYYHDNIKFIAHTTSGWERWCQMEILIAFTKQDHIVRVEIPGTDTTKNKNIRTDILLDDEKYAIELKCRYPDETPTDFLRRVKEDAARLGSEVSASLVGYKRIALGIVRRVELEDGRLLSRMRLGFGTENFLGLNEWGIRTEDRRTETRGPNGQVIYPLTYFQVVYKAINFGTTDSSSSTSNAAPPFSQNSNSTSSSSSSQAQQPNFQQPQVPNFQNPSSSGATSTGFPGINLPSSATSTSTQNQGKGSKS